VNPERWGQIKRICDAALELNPSQRGSFLQEACVGDQSLRQEVESLLARQSQAEGFLETPALEEAARSLAKDQNSAVDADLVGCTLHHYRITSRIGAGGMGVVYRAEDTLLHRSVAVKVLPETFARDAERLKRFKREAQVLAALNHPNVASIYGLEEVNGRRVLVLELVEGGTLEERLKEGGMSPDEALDIGLQIADGLEAAHNKGIIHRDLKPANIQLTAEGRVKILDFGLAKAMANDPDAVDLSRERPNSMTGSGVILGTLGYMSPEQACGKMVDQRTDIWAFGCVLYECLTARRAFQRKTLTETLAAILGDEPDWEALPRFVQPRVVDLLRRCLQKDPKDRLHNIANARMEIEQARSGGSAQARRTPSRWKFAAILLVPILMAMALAFWTLKDHEPVVSVGKISSIAVLPLENLSGDPEQEYFVDGMTDALITDLSKIGALRVISRSSVMRYKGANKPPAEVARELKVDALLEASVVREAGRVRVYAQLVDAATEHNLWAESFEREFSSILAVQAEVAREVARTLQVLLSPGEQARLGSARTVNPATFEAYLKGMFYLNKSTSEDTLKGIAYLHEAVDKDPADALAYGGLALGYVEIAHGAEARDDSLMRAKAAAETALKLDDSLAEVQAAMGFVKGYYEWKWEEAFRHLDLALKANPSLAIGYYHRAWFHVLFGRWTEAIEDHKRARELDPFNPLHTAWLGELYRCVGRLDEAEEEALKSIQMAPRFPPGYFVLGLVYQDRGMYDKAIGAMQKAAEASPAWRWALGSAYIKAGRAEEARKLLDELNKLKLDPFRAFGKAQMYAYLGENDEAFRWLSYEPHHAWVVFVRVLDWFGPLREDPRLPDLMAHMNLPD